MSQHLTAPTIPNTTVALLERPLSIRVSPQNYLAALMVGTFFCALLFYLEMDAVAVLVFAISWVALPFFAWNDHVQFDGRRLERTGVLPRLWARITSRRRRLRVNDVEQVETRSIRSAKRGGNVYYRYRTIIRGRGLTISLGSGGDPYRVLVKEVLSRVPPDSLDLRSSDLRDFLSDPKETLTKAEFARLPSADILRDALRMGKRKGNKRPIAPAAEEEHAKELHLLGNELRVGGYLLQALEALRRALVLRPTDAELLLDFGRCLHSFGLSEGDRRVQRTAIAILRLSQRRAADDPDVLIRLGETYFQVSQIDRAAVIFQRAVECIGDNFRAARGLAEIALQEGKIAHVVHHFASANRSTKTSSLRRWASAEADYFAHLNNDAEYMGLELSRVNLLEMLESSRRTVLRINLLSIPVVIVGNLFEEALALKIGWTVSTVAVLFWTVLTLVIPMFSGRTPYELVDQDD